MRQITPAIVHTPTKSRLSSCLASRARQIVPALSCRVRIPPELEKFRKCWHEYLAFATLVPEICVALNNTANSTTSSPTGSSTPAASSTLTPVTGEASKFGSGILGLVGMAFLVWMLWALMRTWIVKGIRDLWEPQNFEGSDCTKGPVYYICPLRTVSILNQEFKTLILDWPKVLECLLVCWSIVNLSFLVIA